MSEKDIVAASHSEQSRFLLDINIANPITRSAREARFNLLSFKVRTFPVNERLINTLERIDVDHRVSSISNLAGNERHHPASRADVKRRGLRSKSAFRGSPPVANFHVQCCCRLRCPHAAVPRAKRAVARARRDVEIFPRPVERKRDIATVAFADDQHTSPRSIVGCLTGEPTR